MMSRRIESHETPGWSYSVEEVSLGVYHVLGRDTQGRSVDLRGTNPDELLARARDEAARISSDRGAKPQAHESNN